nr:hypothetical protein [uncultured Cardiobacterium sp.]
MFSVWVKANLSHPPDAGERLAAPLALGAVDDVEDGHAVADFVNVVVDDVGIGQAAGVLPLGTWVNMRGMKAM